MELTKELSKAKEEFETTVTNLNVEFESIRAGLESKLVSIADEFKDKENIAREEYEKTIQEILKKADLLLKK